MGWMSFHSGPQTSIPPNWKEQWGEKLKIGTRNAFIILPFQVHSAKFIVDYI